VLLLVAVACVAVPARADPTTMCPDDQTCAFPSPQECSTGTVNGAWDGGPPGRGAICVGGAGHVAAYVGGDPTQLCGDVIVADTNVVDGPTSGWGSDPNHCPYFGWPSTVHDPSVAKSRGTYYLFGTGPGIPIWTSHDLRTWTRSGAVFENNLPSWASTTIPGTQFPWAPDISYFAGRWHVYYAISTFGSKTSAIGFATSPTLDPHARGYGWTDHGVVVRSNETTDYNAIDPNIVAEGSDVSLVLGSFFGGIKLFKLDPATGKIPASLAVPTPIASRLVPTWGIEGSFVVHRDRYYYLFVSFDNCCRGAESTYNVRVGRATAVDGPYVDDAGVPLLLGGGRLVLASAGTRRGPGHEAVLHDGKQWQLFFHYYDASDKGTAKLGILRITWTTDGWPTVSWSAFAPPRMGAA
jgi:arabinan endo-1,5-alpha-L-arabinosidase